ncbi:MAG: cell division protein FtsX [Candidatus Paceibacteria bacterium]
MFTALSRILKSGFQTFSRNAWLSAATIGIMIMTLFVFSSLVLFNFLTKEVVALIQEKIDVSLYFEPTIDEAEILKARDLIEQLPEVAKVEYISREEALLRFRERHKDNPVIIQALEELGSNPLQPVLAIKAKDSTQYAAIITFIEQTQFKEQIAKINFAENQLVIERLNRLISGVKRAGVGLSVVLALMAGLISFNTIRMAIYSFREEIGIMKLVGASNWFVRGPFVIMGIMVSLIASVFTLVILWPSVLVLSPKISAFVPGTNLYGFFTQNIFSIFLLQTVAGIVLGIVSSLIAINKYLKV